MMITPPKTTPSTDIHPPQPSERTPDDPRTTAGAFITNGHRLYEIGVPAEDGTHAINVATGYPIVLTAITIEACWLVPRSNDFDELLK